MSQGKYDMRLNPVYQVDYSTSTKGKRFSLTKRNVRFNYGFSNAEAIAQGLQGIHCRGEEHEIILVWSLTSGKRLVTADGVEVHFSRGKRTEMRFECSWTTKGNHVMKLVAHATRLGQGDNPSFRQFDLFLDGLSFFSMPKIFELGVVASKEILKRGGQKHLEFATPHPVERDFAPPSTDRCAQSGQQHRSALANNGSLSEELHQPKRAHTPTPSVAPTPVSKAAPAQDLLSFAQPATMIERTLLPASMPVVDEFVPAPPPPKTYNDVSSQILQAYGPAPREAAPLALAYEPHTFHTPVPPQHLVTVARPAVVAPQPPASVQGQSMYFDSSGSVSSGTHSPSCAFFESSSNEYFGNELETTLSSPTSVRQLSEVEKAMSNLVNIDDISAPVLSSIKLSTPKNSGPKIGDIKSRPLPPVSSWNVGSEAPLASIKAAAQRPTPSREVMRASASQLAQGSNMLVVYGTNPKEAPPLQPVYHPYGRASFAH